MLTESARMSSAAEARFRIQEPNSRPRAVRVIALDPPSEAIVERLAHGPWPDASFLKASATGRAPAIENPLAPSPWLRDLSNRSLDLDEVVGSADLVVMVAAPGGDAHFAALIGRACSDHRINTTGYIAGAATASDEDVSRTLIQLRPWSLMVVIANQDDYIDDMLTALHA